MNNTGVNHRYLDTCFYLCFSIKISSPCHGRHLILEITLKHLSLFLCLSVYVCVCVMQREEGGREREKEGEREGYTSASTSPSTMTVSTHIVSPKCYECDQQHLYNFFLL